MTALIAAQDRVKIEPDQSYLVLSTKKLKTMESELNEVSALRYSGFIKTPRRHGIRALHL